MRSPLVEFGCGTGRFAARLLDQAPAARYLGLDIGTTMIAQARRRMADGSADRVISTYVLDRLPDPDIGTFFAEARRVLGPDGHLCLVSLTRGRTLASRLVSGVWNAVFRLNPRVVGGCRPIGRRAYCERGGWDILFRRVVASWGIPSEVLVARAGR